jgi:hypothetical protein
MSSALGTGVKLGGAINHLTLVVVSFGRCVVLGARVGVPLALWCTGSLFAMDFPFMLKKEKPCITIQVNISTQTDTKTRSQI